MQEGQEDEDSRSSVSTSRAIDPDAGGNLMQVEDDETLDEDEDLEHLEEYEEYK